MPFLKCNYEKRSSLSLFAFWYLLFTFPVLSFSQSEGLNLKRHQFHSQHRRQEEQTLRVTLEALTIFSFEHVLVSHQTCERLICRRAHHSSGGFTNITLTSINLESKVSVSHWGSLCRAAQETHEHSALSRRKLSSPKTRKYLIDSKVRFLN